MQIVIDIPEHIYEHAKESSEDSRDEFDAMRAIANGTQQESRSEIPNKSEIPTSCGDAISRQAVLDCFKKWQPYMATRLWDFEQELSALPSVTPQRRTGRWIEVIDETDSLGNKTWHHECSICGSDKSGWGTYKHCPDCGTKMEVKDAD